jgi:hypothetical protein
MKVMNILIWLRQVETAGMEQPSISEEDNDEPAKSDDSSISPPMQDKN